VRGSKTQRTPVRLKPVIEKMREVGSPWIYGNDDPASLLPSWKGEAIDPAVVGNGWGRWPFPARPGVKPTGFLIAVEKEAQRETSRPYDQKRSSAAQIAALHLANGRIESINWTSLGTQAFSPAYPTLTASDPSRPEP
jgi:hypothetical protein